MLAKRYRLPIQDFKQKKGTAISGNLFSLKAFSPKENFGRFGVIVRAKVIRTATQRNQIKRVVFDFIKENQSKILETKDYLLISLPGLKNENKKHDIINELKKLFNL